jgi:hypothetical protein
MPPEENEIETPWRQAKKKQSYMVQEAKLSASPGARAQVNSGRTWFSKRDVRKNGFLIEARTTQAGSYTIKEAEWEKLTGDSFGQPPGLLPAMQIDLQEHHLWVMRQEDWDFFQLMYTEALDELKRLRTERP